MLGHVDSEVPHHSSSKFAQIAAYKAMIILVDRADELHPALLVSRRSIGFEGNSIVIDSPTRGQLHSGFRMRFL